jgi:hypothetical protein
LGGHFTRVKRWADASYWRSASFVSIASSLSVMPRRSCWIAPLARAGVATSAVVTCTRAVLVERHVARDAA